MRNRFDHRKLYAIAIAFRCADILNVQDGLLNGGAEQGRLKAGFERLSAQDTWTFLFKQYESERLLEVKQPFCHLNRVYRPLTIVQSVACQKALQVIGLLNGVVDARFPHVEAGANNLALILIMKDLPLPKHSCGYTPISAGRVAIVRKRALDDLIRLAAFQKLWRRSDHLRPSVQLPLHFEVERRIVRWAGNYDGSKLLSGILRRCVIQEMYNRSVQRNICAFFRFSSIARRCEGNFDGERAAPIRIWERQAQGLAIRQEAPIRYGLPVDGDGLRLAHASQPDFDGSPFWKSRA